MGFSIALIIIVLIVLYSLARTAGESDRTMEQIREQSLLGRELLFVEVIGVLHTYELTSLSNHCPDRYGHWLVLHTYELTSLSNDAINCFRNRHSFTYLRTYKSLKPLRDDKLIFYSFTYLRTYKSLKLSDWFIFWL